MNDILSSLYNCATESRSEHFLAPDDLRDYKSALRSLEKLEGQLEEILKDEPLRLFKLYVDNSEEAQYHANVSAFRKGLAMGLKLGVFAMSKS